MQAAEEVEAQQLKVALHRRLFDVQKYMAFVEILKTGSHKAQLERLQDETLPKVRQQRLTFLREQLKKDPAFNMLNKTTLNTIIDFATLIHKEINIEKGNFASEPEIKRCLEPCSIENLKLLNDNLIKLEKKQKISKRWDKLTDAFYVAAQAVTPLAHMPILQVVAIPIMNGFWGCWYASWAISIGYDPALGGKIEPINSTFNKASYLSGGIATAAAIAGLIPPFLLLPICAPIAAIGLLTSNVLWTAGAMLDFYKEIKNRKPGPGRNWQIAGKASTVLYTVGSIVIAALAIAALFTPVGWAAGAAAVAFGIGAATASLSVFAISKFCHWRAEKAGKTTVTPTTGIPLSVAPTILSKPEHTQTRTAEVTQSAQATATTSSQTPDTSSTLNAVSTTLSQPARTQATEAKVEPHRKKLSQLMHSFTHFKKETPALPKFAPSNTPSQAEKDENKPTSSKLEH